MNVTQVSHNNIRTLQNHTNNGCPFFKYLKKIAKTGKNMFCGIIPYMTQIPPNFISKNVNLRQVVIIASLPGLYHQVNRNYKSALDFTNAVTSIAMHIFAIALVCGYIPVDYRLTAENALLLTSTIGSCHSIYKGTRKINVFLRTDIEERDSKVSFFATGMILIMIGSIGLHENFNQGINTFIGSEKLLQYDSQQKHAILKNKSVQYLRKPKTCTAVIFTGPATPEKEQPIFGLAESLYEHCDTRSYDVLDNSSAFCEFLRESNNFFNNRIDEVALIGHADNRAMWLGNNYFFNGNEEEMSCMNEFLSPTAQVFLAGCNTATSSNYTSLTEQLSQSLSGREINGYAAYYNPHMTTTKYVLGRFQHDNHVPYNLNGYVSPISTVVTLKS